MRFLLLLSGIAAALLLSACETGGSPAASPQICYPHSIPLGAPPGCSTELHREGEWASYAETRVTRYTDEDCYVTERGFGEMGAGYDPGFITDGESRGDLAAWSRGARNSGDDFDGDADFGIYVRRQESARTFQADGGNFSVSIVFRPGQLTREFGSRLDAGPRTVSFQFEGSAPLIADTSVPFKFDYISDSLWFHDTGFENRLMTYLFIEAHPTSRLRVSLNHPDTGETYVGEINFRGARPAFWAAHDSLASLLERGCAK